MNILAAVSTGDVSDYIMMIRGGCRLRVIEMKSDPLAISSPVFRFPRYATANHTICQKEKILEFRVSHFSSYAPAII